MKIIKEGKIKKSRYLLIDRIEPNGLYIVLKYGVSRVTIVYSSSSMVSASMFFDKLFLQVMAA